MIVKDRIGYKDISPIANLKYRKYRLHICDHRARVKCRNNVTCMMHQRHAPIGDLLIKNQIFHFRTTSANIDLANIALGDGMMCKMLRN